MRFSVIFLFLLFPFVFFAQNDSIWMKNNDILVGELKSLSKSVMTLKTSYSDKDFKIDFDEVSAFSTERLCTVYLTDRSRYTGKIKRNNSGMLQIVNAKKVLQEFDIKKLLSLAEINEKFWDRFTGALDLGFNMSKTNNNRQLTFAGNIKYSSDQWNTKFSYNALYSDQDNTERIERKEFSFSGQRFIKKWYLEVNLGYLSSTELGIKNRINPGLGLGKFISTTNKLYFLAGAGLNYNIEEYFDDTLNKKSTELRLLTQFEMFNYQDFRLFTNVTGYPSISEKGRFRVDYNLVLKYDLPFDFYIKADFTSNYDNQPAVEGNNFDYVFSSGIGWELK